MKRPVTGGVFAAFLWALMASSDLTQGPSSVPPKRTVIRAAAVLDVKTGQVLRDGAIVIVGDKIVSLGPASAVAPAASAIVINLPTATVLPGLIDAHTHLTFNPSFGYEDLAISVPREALIGAHNARITLEAGFTTVRNVGPSGYSDVALRDAINAGDVPGPRMLVSGPPLSITGGHCDNDLLPFEYHASADGAWKACSTRLVRSSSTARI